jgi:alpha-1,3-glucosyltransferase
MHLFTSLGFFSVASLLIFFASFLYPLSQLSQALTRIFPFSRGLFEDKVANVWCSLNVIIKLREIASIPTLARLSAVITLGTTMPIVLGVAWVSWQLRQGATGSQAPKNTLRSPAPTIKLLPYALFASSMAFFLFSFQVHEKSILLPLMPLTLLLAGKQPGLAGQDFEWIMLLNNVAAFR